jgi:hypothetical protein
MEPDPNPASPLEVVRRTLESRGHELVALPGQDGFEVDRPGEYEARCYYQVFPEREQFLFYVIPIMQVFRDDLAAVAEYFTWVNSGMRVGNFELDQRDGTMRCKASFDFSGTSLEPRMIENAAARALEAFDRYIGGAVRVVAGLATPLEAVNAIDRCWIDP